MAELMFLSCDAQSVPAVTFIRKLTNVIKRPDRLLRDVVNEMSSDDYRSTLDLFRIFSQIILALNQQFPVHFEELDVILSFLLTIILLHLFLQVLVSNKA